MVLDTSRASGSAFGRAGCGLHNSTTALDTDMGRWNEHLSASMHARVPKMRAERQVIACHPDWKTVLGSAVTRPLIGQKHLQPIGSLCNSCTSLHAQSRLYLGACPRAQLSQPTWGWPLWTSLMPQYRLQRPYGSTAAASPGSQLAPSCTPSHLERPMPPTTGQCDATASKSQSE